MHKFFIFLLASIMVACTTDEGTNLDECFVVEGWIEDNGYPMVKLTYSIPIKEDYQSLDSLERYIARWERITISDGSQTVTLTGRMNDAYFPPYVYTTTDMKGVAGRTYTLTVHASDYGKRDITAVTTIPPVAPAIDSFSVASVSSEDKRYQLFAHTNIPAQPITYYKIFTQVGNKSQDFLSSYLGVLRSDMIPADGQIAIHQGRTNLDKEFTPYFTEGDTVSIRFARIDSISYEYWRAYEDMLSLSRNPLFPATISMPHTILGAYGFWQGYGSRYYSVRITKPES